MYISYYIYMFKSLVVYLYEDVSLCSFAMHFVVLNTFCFSSFQEKLYSPKLWQTRLLQRFFVLLGQN